MTFEEHAARLDRDGIVLLLVEKQELSTRADGLRTRNDMLTTRVGELEQQLAWFKRQIFGAKSERRIFETADAHQATLGEPLTPKLPAPPLVSTTAVRGHVRRGNKKPLEGSPDDSGLRFDASVPVEEIVVPNPDIATLPPESYDIIGDKVTYRLAQRPGAYVVLRYVRQVVKLKPEGTFSSPPAPASVLEKSFADVSLLALLLIDKLIYHLPLYRQHQRLLASGIHLSRSTLTQWVHRAIALLEPIYEAQRASVLASSVLVMDETPVKAGRVKPKGPSPGKMKTGFFWPMYGDHDEIVFPFAPTRAHAVAEELLRTFKGVLLSDGYDAYSCFAAKVEEVVHALCWSHLRRYFIESEPDEPQLSQKAIEQIRTIYAHEATIRERALEGEKKLEYRAIHCKPVVDELFNWMRGVFQEHLLLPKSLFTKAVNYGLEREAGLRVFLENPDVPIDTNHLERQERPVAIGRRNWLFCWTEIGAKYVGIGHSLLATCRLQNIDPYTYLVDVLQRIETHPARDVHLLTPRLWKQHFAANPLRSNLDRIRQRSPA